MLMQSLEMIYKQEPGAPYDMKQRDVEYHLFAWEQLLQRQNDRGLFIAL